MSLLVGGVQANPSTYYSPIVGKATVLATTVATGQVNYNDPSGLQPGLYAVMIGSSVNGTNISSLLYFNGTNWSAGGYQNNNGPTVEIFSSAPFTQISTNNTTGSIISAPVYLIPISIGAIQGMS